MQLKYLIVFVGLSALLIGLLVYTSDVGKAPTSLEETPATIKNSERKLSNRGRTVMKTTTTSKKSSVAIPRKNYSSGNDVPTIGNSKDTAEVHPKDFALRRSGGQRIVGKKTVLAANTDPTSKKILHARVLFQNGDEIGAKRIIEALKKEMMEKKQKDGPESTGFIFMITSLMVFHACISVIL